MPATGRAHSNPARVARHNSATDAQEGTSEVRGLGLDPPDGSASHPIPQVSAVRQRRRRRELCWDLHRGRLSWRL